MAWTVLGKALVLQAFSDLVQIPQDLHKEPGTAVHAHNSSTWQTETGGSLMLANWPDRLA